MSETANLTWQEIAVHAKRTGNDDIADWIIAEQALREEARQSAANEPFTMAAGTFEVDHWYNVTIKGKRYKQVRFTRRDSFARAALTYASNKVAFRFYKSDMEDAVRLDRIIEHIVEVPAPTT